MRTSVRRWVNEQGFALCTFDALVHVGTMHIEDKGYRGPSHEGEGLSVSTCPQAWVRIAKLGGLPWFELTRPENVFLDAHALSQQASQRMARWGLENGWVENEALWQARYWDDELDAEVTSLHPTREEALAEAFEDESCVRCVAVLAARPSLVARMNQRIDFGEAESLLHAVYAEDVLALDGVFWEDVLDVSRLSAPRAVVFRNRVPAWHVRQVRD
jgi:hypothetical protein